MPESIEQPMDAIKNLIAEFDEFAEETKNLPIQHEDEYKGQCTYNWHIDIVRRFAPLVSQVKAAISKVQKQSNFKGDSK